MAIRFIIDSASDILPAEAEQMGVRMVPLTLHWDGQEYRDGFDIDFNTFYKQLAISPTIPTTAQVTPRTFEKAYRELTANGDIVIVITLSSGISGTYQSAVLAAEDFEGRVFIVDSLSASVGERVLLQQALRYVEQGMDAEAIVDRLNREKSHLHLLARVDTLEYLRKGGRISSAVALAGGLLSIKPVLTLTDGVITMVGKARGSKNSNNILRKFINNVGGIDFARPLCLLYSGLSTEPLQQYIDDSVDMWQNETDNLPYGSLGAVIGTHVGPGAIGIAFFDKQ